MKLTLHLQLVAKYKVVESINVTTSFDFSIVNGTFLFNVVNCSFYNCMFELLITILVHILFAHYKVHG